MRDHVREASVREMFVNLPDDVVVEFCTAEQPMPAHKTDDPKILWIHDGAEETEASKELDMNTVYFRCKFCGYEFSVELGDLTL